jgi:hypothetical protein
MRGLARALTGAVLAGSLGMLSGCSNDEIAGVQTGEIEVVLGMEGADVDSDGGLLLLDGENQGQLSVNVRRILESLEEGIYVIEVTGIAQNCTVAGENPRNVRVRAGQTTHEAFNYTCEAVGPKDPDDGDPEA